MLSFFSIRRMTADYIPKMLQLIGKRHGHNGFVFDNKNTFFHNLHPDDS